MILLVPTAPEVPKVHKPFVWPGLVLVLILCLGFIKANTLVEADSQYIDSIQPVLERESQTDGSIERLDAYLRLRPLLKIAVSRDDVDLPRLLASNFLHGSVAHLSLNLIAAFAGARILTSFIPFLCTLSIFVIAGSVGLYVSLLLTAQTSGFIPHLGASAGIFALMGAYYVYNFRYRTYYFFWFPSRHGQIALKTSWFFFFDVLLLELIFSATQLFPNQVDSFDHVAHVVGFASGVVLAIGLRVVQRWPSFLQTRGEFLYWSKLIIPRNKNIYSAPCDAWLELLDINRYNDQLKLKLCRLVATNHKSLSDTQVQKVIGHFSPTFVRLHGDVVATVLRECLRSNRLLNTDWLEKLPYDSFIRIAKNMASPVDQQVWLVRFIEEYQLLHPVGSATEKKLDLLVRRLTTVLETQKPLTPRIETTVTARPDETPGTSNAETDPQEVTRDYPLQKAKSTKKGP